MAVTDYIFPLDASQISWNSKLKSKWNVTSFRSAGQVYKSLVQQSRPLWTISIDFPRLNKYELDKLIAFHAMCKGSWHPFYYKDYENYGVIGKTLEQDTDGNYQAVIPFGTYEEPAPLIDNVVMWVDGVKSTDFTVDGGLITVTAVGDEIKFDYEYYYKVIFTETLSITQQFYDLYRVGLTLEVVE